MAEPWHADTAADPFRIRADRLDHADDLVVGDERQLRLRQVFIDHMQIGPAHGTGLDPQSYLSGTWVGKRAFDRYQRLSDFLKHHRSHRRAFLGEQG